MSIIVDAKPGFDARTREPIVTFRFGARGFAQTADRNSAQTTSVTMERRSSAKRKINSPR
jgi:hypothetical protein